MEVTLKEEQLKCEALVLTSPYYSIFPLNIQIKKTGSYLLLPPIFLRYSLLHNGLLTKGLL